MNGIVQSYVSKMENMECRKCSVITTVIPTESGEEREYKKLEVFFDDEECNRVVMYDKNLENEGKYERGKVGTLFIRTTTEVVIKTSKSGKPYPTEKTTTLIEDFVAKRGKK